MNEIEILLRFSKSKVQQNLRIFSSTDSVLHLLLSVIGRLYGKLMICGKSDVLKIDYRFECIFRFEVVSLAGV